MVNLPEPQHWIADNLEDVLQQGRHGSLLVGCHPLTGSNKPRSFVVKPLGLPDVTAATIFRETIGTVLANALGVTVPAPALVEIDEAFARSIEDIDAMKGRRIRPSIAFGSEYLGRGLATPTPETRYDTEELVNDAARIYGFDLAFQNMDRIPTNPNCILVSERLFAIDFERAFEFTWRKNQERIRATQPNKLWIARRHVCYGIVSRRRDALRRFANDLGELEPKSIDEALAWMPAQWHHDGKLISKHVEEIRNDFDTFTDNLLGAVTP